MGLPEERKLFDAALDMPFGVGALLEEDNVAGTVTGWTDRIAFKDDRALEDQDRFVEIVVPVEFPFAAFPDHGPCQPVSAF